MTMDSKSHGPLRVVLIGCVASTEVALNALLAMRSEDVILVGLMTMRKSTFNSDFVDVASVVKDLGTPILFCDDGLESDVQADWIRSLAPDLIFVVGWSRLLKENILCIPSLGVIGFHPSALPLNRGRHPLVWALVLGLKETASSFFLMGTGADDGPIVSQYPISISDTDDAMELYSKVLRLIPIQILEIVHSFKNGTLIPKVQDETASSYWRKRSPKDGLIDWRMSARSIYNLVRALSHPYPGAHFLHSGEVCKVWKCKIDMDVDPNAEPGKVLDVQNGDILVKTGDQAIWLTVYEITSIPVKGDYL